MFKHPSDKIYPDVKMKNTTFDLDGVFTCCTKAVMRAHDPEKILPEGCMVICDQCGDGMALFDGRWVPVYKTNRKNPI